MKTRTLRFLILTGLFQVCALFGYHKLINITMTWPEARKYCRDHFTDLSAVSNWKEDGLLNRVRLDLLNTTKVWIGLYKDDNDTWMWSGGKMATYFKWSGLTNSSDRCVAQNVYGWHIRNCETKKLFFFCYKSSQNLVKENVTWEEAMQICRNQNTDLVSVNYQSTAIKTLQSSREAQTTHIWTGLRYLADKWLWINGQEMWYDGWSKVKLPQCPAWGRHCGVLSLEGHHWDSWDCTDKLNFVCY